VVLVAGRVVDVLVDVVATAAVLDTAEPRTT
jgi:hypothetical protein